MYPRHEDSPYIKLMEKIGLIDVWIVDGEYIRGNLQPQFTNHAHSLDREYKGIIPKNEFWIDIGCDTEEYDWYLEFMFEECYHLSRLVPEKKAEQYAIMAVNREKERSKRRGGAFHEIPNINVKVLQDEIKTDYQDEPIKLLLVYGKLIREPGIDPLFAHGGHDLVYPEFVPNNTVWIDNTAINKAWAHLAVHECGERKDMHRFGGKGDTSESYKKAHRIALRDEQKCMHDEEHLLKRLQDLGITCFT
jgi:hypothetical protein